MTMDMCPPAARRDSEAAVSSPATLDGACVGACSAAQLGQLAAVLLRYLSFIIVDCTFSTSKLCLRADLGLDRAQISGFSHSVCKSSMYLGQHGSLCTMGPSPL